MPQSGDESESDSDEGDDLSQLSEAKIIRLLLGSHRAMAAATNHEEKTRLTARHQAIVAELQARVAALEVLTPSASARPSKKSRAQKPAKYVIPTADDLKNMSVPELEQAYAGSVQAAAVTDHVGRQNRLARVGWSIAQELKARGEARSAFQQLAKHSDADVRRSAKSRLDWLEKPPLAAVSEPRPKGRFWPHIVWQCDNPPPPALTRSEIAERLRRAVPEFCDRLMDLLLPAIGLWPQRRADVAPTASRFGGKPLAPPDWQWPALKDEPLLFVGQIKCAEVRSLPGAELLPSSGLLAFFGDHDAVTGCFPFASGGVYHWPDVSRLVQAIAPIEPLEIFPSCAVAMRPILDLPHPFSRAVSGLDLNEPQRRSYFDVWLEIRNHGIPPEYVGYAGFSKLLGWPDLVQNDLQGFDGDARLLLQVDAYCNGEELHGWGPGGSLYYVLPERDLQAGSFKRCELEGQFT